MGDLQGALGICAYEVGEEDVGRMTRMFPAGAGGTRGAPGDNDPCSVNCSGGNISGPP
jgi:hypothetical protein